MIVSRSTFKDVLALLMTRTALSCDTETQGLRPYHGDRLFSLIISDELNAYYFNFQHYEGLGFEEVLSSLQLRDLKQLFNREDVLWYFANAKYDLTILANETIEVRGEIHDVLSTERIIFNDYLPGTYDLDSVAKRRGFEKDGTVEKYIEDNKLWTWSAPEKPGKREKELHFEKVPFEIIAPYGERDGRITFDVGTRQALELADLSEKTPAPLPTVLNIHRNEKRLLKTIFRMEQTGVKIDRPYCVRAAHFEADRAAKAEANFKRETGRDFKASGKLFSEIFASEKERWVLTDKGNPSFDSDVLASFKHPAARAILDYRDAKSKSDFYKGFLWHADRNDVIHPNFNPAGTATGRFSSSNPNFQNLTSEENEDLTQEFCVRRAIIPRPGFVFIMPDYDQMEYRMMFDYACVLWGSETELVRKIKEEGLDPHQATADLVTAQGRMKLTRKVAKNGNFAELYGSGLDTLAATLHGTREDASALKEALRAAAPEVRNLVNIVSATARQRGSIRNWAGRISHLRNQNLAYKMTNYLIQGGCADVNKFALNGIDEFLQGKKSQLVLTIHDENPVEVHESEISEVPKRVKEIMESVYPHKYLPLTCGMEWSDKSLADKKKGFPV